MSDLNTFVLAILLFGFVLCWASVIYFTVQFWRYRGPGMDFWRNFIAARGLLLSLEGLPQKAEMYFKRAVFALLASVFIAVIVFNLIEWQ